MSKTIEFGGHNGAMMCSCSVWAEVGNEDLGVNSRGTNYHYDRGLDAKGDGAEVKALKVPPNLGVSSERTTVKGCRGYWRRSGKGLCHRERGNFEKEEVVHSQNRQRARTGQRPLGWKIPMTLPASIERLE